MPPAAFLLLATFHGALALLAVEARPLDAQSVTSSLEISVRAAADDRPLPGARVRIDGIGINYVTDESGFLRVSGLPSGPRRIQVGYLGFAPLDEVVAFDPARPTHLTVRLHVQPIPLAEVRVRGRQSILVSRGFFERRRFGQGTFYTRDEIEQMRPRYMSDVLRRVAGIQVGNVGVGSRARPAIRGSSAGGLRNCPIQYYIDGTFTSAFDIDDVVPTDVEGIEIYKGAATLPPSYNKGTASCGLVLIWTRVE
jgi:hypothetical protein